MEKNISGRKAPHISDATHKNIRNRWRKLLPKPRRQQPSRRRLSYFSNKYRQLRYYLLILALFIIIILSCGGYHYLQRSQSVTRVNGAYIDSNIHSERISYRQMFLESQSQVATPEAISQDVLNLIIDEALISQYAQDNDIYATQTEIDTRYRQLIDTYRETELEDRLTELYDPRGVDNYSEVIRADILRDKVQSALPDMSLREWLENERSEAQIDIFHQE